ncbi:abortive phage infection protein [Lentzea sp. BCCO 10_0856]|uniref:Abortive phage infection protein n=1 Tax=Lentzea miocenica TaxID=3095431 RepID=A0ABU4TDZ4_9PSEU|nr:abortive phage infection protein [Lentzea sp. BCCO 10_0856]MDX8036102.1 abortive phage infection protein [Lentzea sp. BCCO 10_0856]
MFSRKVFLKSALGAAALVGLGGGTASAAGRPRGGVCYDTGVLHAAGDPLSRVRWSRQQLEREIAMIANELRCPSITAFGTDLGRLAETTDAALRRGMQVFVQPRLYDHPQEEILTHLAEAARTAERKRRGDNVKFVTGCEHFLFTPGIIPGATFLERIENMASIPASEWPAIVRRFREFMGRAVEVTRREFHGRITYGAAAGADAKWNDWSLFDIVGLDYYRYFATDDEYTKDLDQYRRWNKPLMVLEFGCCTFTGAAEAGGMGWDIVDYEVDPPVVKPGYVRNEREQADHIARMLRVFGAQRDVEGAHLYSVITPDSPHHPTCRDRDYDMASYGLLRPIRERFDDDNSPYRLEPKQSFHAFRQHNR